MLVERDRQVMLPNSGAFKKSATENSELNKRAQKSVGRYSGSFSPPGDTDVRAIYDITTVKEVEINNFKLMNSTPTRGEGTNKPLDSKLLKNFGSFGIKDSEKEEMTVRGRDSLFTPQLKRREQMQMFESPLLGGKRTPLAQFKNSSNFSSPKSERGFPLRRDRCSMGSPAR